MATRIDQFFSVCRAILRRRESIQEFYRKGRIHRAERGETPLDRDDEGSIDRVSLLVAMFRESKGCRSPIRSSRQNSFKRAIIVNISPYDALEDLRFIIAKAINYTEEQTRK